MHPLLADVDWLPEAQRLSVSLISWLKEWQVLVALLVAVVAGAIILRSVTRQMREQHLEVVDRARRLAKAFRASMPEDLYAMCAYAHRSADLAREGVMLIDAEEGHLTKSPKGRSKLRCPSVPNQVLVNLKALIEHLDNESAEQVANLLGCYHTQHMRMAGALENFDRKGADAITISGNVNFNPVFKDTLELYLRAKSMLEFARGESEKISGSFGASDVTNALRELNLDHAMSPEAKEHCLRFLSAQNPKWKKRMLRKLRPRD
jgi:hypothetical protein